MSDMSDEERTPPTRIRLTGLQEAQVAELERFEYAAANEGAEAGIADHPPRNQVAIVRLARSHHVVVAEADHEVAGYIGWRDEAPGVAVIDALVIGPEYRRFGIGTRLLRELGERARKAGIIEAVVRVHPKATWAQAFLTVLGFTPLVRAPGISEKLATWREEHAADLAGPEPYWWRGTAKLGVTELPGVPLP